MTTKEHAEIAKYRLDRAHETFFASKSLLDTELGSAANRLYYAVFSAMRAVLALEGVDFKKHSAVIAHFRQQYIKTGVFDRKYSELIRVAAQIRTDSDYKDLYVPNREEISLLMQDAEPFIAVVEMYVNEKLELSAPDYSGED